MSVTERNLLEIMPVASFVIDRNHRVLHWNRACEHLTGILANKMIGTSRHWRAFYLERRPIMADLILSKAPDEDVTALYGESWRRHPENGGIEASAFCPALPGGGRWLTFTASPVLDADGAMIGAIETCTDINERVHADIERRASEQLLTEIIEGNPVPTFVIGADHRVTHWNRACEVVMGLPASEMIGTRDQWRAFYPKPRPVLADLILEHAGQADVAQYYGAFKPSSFIEDAYEAEAFFPHFPGGGRWLFFTAAPLRGLDGAFIGAVETLQDTTERKRAEEAHAESQRRIGEEKYSTLFKEMINAIAVFEIVSEDEGRPVDFRYLAVNPAFEAMTGLRADDIVGHGMREVMPSITDPVLEQFAKVVRTGEPDFLETVNPDLEKYFDIRAFRPAAGQLAVTFLDVTDRKRAETRLRLLASVFEHTQEGVVITNPSNVIIEVNEAYCRITGYGRDDLIGKTPRLLKSGHHGPEFYNAMWMTIKKDGVWHGEIWNRRKNGEVFPTQLTISAVLDKTERPSHYVGVVVDITAIKRHQAELDRIAHYDALTGLPNRVLLHDRMLQAIARAQRNKSLLAVCFLDVDGFKPVNDTLGHGAGDALLIELADRFRAELRGNDTVARLGGDEFIILLADLNDQPDCVHILDRILATVGRPFDIDSHRVSVTASVGVTLYPVRATDTDTLLRQADQAMYKSKQMGKNTYFFYDDDQDAVVVERQHVIARIRQALSNEEMTLHYQPKVNMRTGEVIGAEALIRWQHPDRGLLPPADFLPWIEDDDLIVALGDWVIMQALRQLNTWEQQGVSASVSVNISARHLQSPQFAERLEHLLQESGRLDKGCLEIEITETAAINDLRHVTQLIDACKALDIRLALDDFGTGYSSLTYLKLLPVNTLKVDKSFVLDMTRDAEDLAIVSGIIGLAKAFNLAVIAEGVETSEHGLLLLDMGCEMAQGYGIAPPMAPDRFPEWVRHWRPEPVWSGTPEPVTEGR